MAWDSLHMGTRVRLIALLALLLVAPIPHLATPGAAPRAHPQLLQMSSADPSAQVRVIVRTTGALAQVEDLTVRSGGEIRTRLPLIDAFAAELPAGRVADLALAPGVRWISPDAPLESNGCRRSCAPAEAFSKYVETIGATRLRAEQPGLAGQGVGVAIVDSGIDSHEDLKDMPSGRSTRYRVVTSALFGGHDGGYTDLYGHGTHVAGIVGGNGRQSDGLYAGVAPRVNLINVKVAGSDGASYTSDLVAGLQWIYQHRSEYNIRVVNISLNSSVAESYHTSPLNAAIEILWFSRVVVVVSAGNNGSGDGVRFPPANDPFVITVGASDDRGTARLDDDVLAPYSAQGLTESGFRKPDVVAPGTNVVSLHDVAVSTLAHQHPDHRIGRHYFRMSGTSMSSAVVAGSVALLLQDEPGLTPDQVKYRLMATARPFAGSSARALNIYDAVRGTTTASANTGVEASRLLWSGSNPVNWDSVNWDSVNWDSVNWDTVNWDSVNWDSVNWDSVNWDD